jgi:hypothetical protein
VLAADLINRYIILHKVTNDIAYRQPTIGITESQGENEICYNKRRKANWIDHILRRNWLLKQVTEEKIEGRREVAGRRG